MRTTGTCRARDQASRPRRAIAGRRLGWWRELLAVALVAAVSAVAAPSARASAPGGRCAAKHSYTLAASADARVYRIARSNDRQPVYGCLYSKNRPVPLAVIRQPATDNCETCPDASVRYVQLAGDYVAYHYTRTSPRCCQTSTRVVNLRRRRLVKRFDNSGLPLGLVLKGSDGAIAWIQTLGTPPGREELRKWDASGQALLDSADASGTGRSGLGALALEDVFIGEELRPQALYWLNDGLPKTAQLK